MAVSESLATALTGLMVQRYGLDITGHNIANASTPGYTRQRAVLAPALPRYFSFGAVGRGVVIGGVQRVVDEFLLTQQRDVGSRLARDGVLASAYSRLEVIFNELSDNDLSTAFDNFFSSLHDLSANAESQATRSLVIQHALALSDAVRVTYGALRDHYVQLNNDLAAQVGVVNGLIDEVADLNRQIVQNEAGGTVSANDLRDRRDVALAELAGMMDITTIEQPGGAVNVTARGMPLVLLTHPFHLETYQTVRGDLPTVEVRFEQDRAPLLAAGGRLAATIEARDTVLASYMRDLDRFAAELIWQFNRIHVQGVGSVPMTSAVGTSAATDPAAALGRLDLGFDPAPGTFRVVNGSVTVAIVALGSGQITEFTVPVDADGVGTDDSLNDFVAAFNAAAPAGTIAASVDAAGRLRFDSADPSAWGFHFGEDSSGLLAAMGVGTFWTGHGAATMDVRPAVVADQRLLAVGRTGAAGDTENLLKLIALREAAVADGGTKTFDEFYRSVVGRLGTEAQRVNDRQSLHSDLATRLENERQAVSGVSLDEELTRMIQFQRAYQAAARLITVSDAMLDTLINRM